MSEYGTAELLVAAFGMLAIASISNTADASNTDAGPSAQPQTVFFTPTKAVHPLPERAWGEPSIDFHDGTYYLYYDSHPQFVKEPNVRLHQNHYLPFYLLTSSDGVYWKEESASSAFTKDDDVTAISCPQVFRFSENGPYVMNYSFKQASDWRIRYATSFDLRNWKKLGPASAFVPDSRWYTDGRWDTQEVLPHPDGGWCGVWNAVPKEGIGMGFGASEDGIRWTSLPPVQVHGLAGAMRAHDVNSAGELGGFLKFGEKYFLLLGEHQDTYLTRVVSAEKPEGPYAPIPRNEVLSQTPAIYERAYQLPDGIMVTGILWLWRDGKRSWYLPPLKLLVSDGESLWMKWWDGNDKLKTNPLPIVPPLGDEPIRMLGNMFSPGKSLVLEGSIRLPFDGNKEPDWAHNAQATASASTACANVEGGFMPNQAVDGKIVTWWFADAEQGEQAWYQLDFGTVRPVGRLRIKWLARNGLPAAYDVRISDDGTQWSDLLTNQTPSSTRAWSDIPITHESLDARARFVRVVMTARKGMRGCGIVEMGVFPNAADDIGSAPGLFFESEGGGGKAVLVFQNGTVRFGSMRGTGSHFTLEQERNIGVKFGPSARFRVVQRDEAIEFYLDDYQIHILTLDRPPTGRIGLIGGNAVQDVMAWEPDPQYP